MPIARIGYGTDFILKNQGVGVATDTTDVKLEVGGTTKANYNISGIASLSNYAGFANAEQNIAGVTTVTGEHSTLGDIVVGVGSVLHVSTGATVDVGTVPSVSIGTHFSPPTGDINDRPEVPVEGTVRFNKDLNTLEFYNGVEWRQFTVSGASGRGLFGGGVSASPNNDSRIELVNMMTGGNSTTFGDRTISANNASACSSATRGLFCGGGDPAGNNTIDYVTIASAGNAIDFGDRTSKQYSSGSCGSSTRGLTGGGNPASNIIDYHQFSTLGDSIDFGDLNATQYGIASASSPTRGFWLGGTNLDGKIQMVTISSTGNAIDFGNLVEKTKNGRACSNTTSLIKGAGVDGDNRLTIETFNMASGGNATFFGNLTELSTFPAAMSSETRGIFCGGRTPTMHNIIQYVTIATSGNAVDFGDITQPNQKMAGCSDSHGGLGGY